VSDLCIKPFDAWRVSVSYDKELKVWELGTGKVLAGFTCDGIALSCAFINDRDLIAGDSFGRVYFLLCSAKTSAVRKMHH
jgi:hypothetical protein